MTQKTRLSIQTVHFDLKSANQCDLRRQGGKQGTAIKRKGALRKNTCNCSADLNFMLELTQISHFLFTGTYAHLSPKHSNFEEKVYIVPVIMNDNGNPSLENKVNLEGMLCTAILSICKILFQDYSNT